MELQKYIELITKTKCTFCGRKLPIRDSAIKMYPHDGGWNVNGYDKKQWLYIICPKCGYQWALWKLGVSRSAGKLK